MSCACAAIDHRFCSREPLACRAVQRVLEREPTLVWQPGVGIVPRVYNVGEPSPPPSLFAYPPPPHTNPSPPPPPPITFAAEPCVPVISLQEAGLSGVLAHSEDRVVCLYVRAIADQQVRASRCYSDDPPSPPPPPPQSNALKRLISSRLRRGAVLRGEAVAHAAAPKTSEEVFAEEHIRARQSQQALLERLAAETPLLRDTLLEMAGRRLFELPPQTTNLDLRHAQAPAAAVLGTPILGVTQAECSSVCIAMHNETNPEATCRGYVFRWANTEATDLSLAECWPVSTLGGCAAVDFAAAVLDRRSADLCRGLTPGELSPRCLALVPGRVETRVLDAAASAAACKGGSGSPPLAQPRSSLEAMSMLGYARERGISAFFAGRPAVSTEEIKTFWSGEDGGAFVIPASDPRCVLVHAENELDGSFVAVMHACSGSKLADGVICESASTGTTMAEASPPPPSARTLSLRLLSDGTVRGLTQAVCAATDPLPLCLQIANAMASPVRSGTLTSVTPLCESVCWPSCASMPGDTDGFDECPDAGCAVASCFDFLTSECGDAEELGRLHTAVCLPTIDVLHPETPLAPPPPDRPPSPPLPPPELVQLVEADSDMGLQDCEPVSYADCLERARLMDIGLELRFAECSSTNELGQDCFVGCAIGEGRAVFSFSTTASPYLSKRCTDAPLETCLCKLAASPPPPRAGSAVGIPGWAGLDDSATGGASGFFSLIGVDKRPSNTWLLSTSEYGCPAGDSGAHECARTCASAQPTASTILFAITGHAAPPSPPPPTPPPQPPEPPGPPPVPPDSGLTPYLWSENCAKNGIVSYEYNICRDGGLGSVHPPICALGSQVGSPLPPSRSISLHQSSPVGQSASRLRLPHLWLAHPRHTHARA